MNHVSSPTGRSNTSASSLGGSTRPHVNLAPLCWRAGFSCIALVLTSAPALAATAPDLGTAASYGIVSSTFTNTTAGTTVDGDVCYTTQPAVAAVTTGATVVPCDPSTGADQNSARADLVSQSCTPIGAAVALNAISIEGGTPGVFPPGCYSSTGAMSITTGTTVTLDGSGVFIFRPGGALNPAADSNVVATDGACADNVFWAPIGATTVGANANFIGTIFRGVADGLSITFGDSSGLVGRALAYGSTVTTDNTTMGIPEPCLEEGTITVNKHFIPDSSGTVSVSLICTSGTVTETPLNASEAVPAVFTVTGADPGATCTATETVPKGYLASEGDCVDVELGGSCQIINIEDTPSDRTTFRVIKDFTDGNPMDVQVTLSCFTGLPLVQSMDISETRDVEFVVTEFDEGELDCDVTEEPLTGYSPTYTAATTGVGLISDDLEGCHFDDVVSGQFICLIVNTPDLVDIEIEKLWVIDGSGGHEVDTNYKLTLFCDAIIEDGQESCYGGGGAEMAFGTNGAYQTCKKFYGNDSQVFIAEVRPDYPSSHCWVHESVYDSGVEVDNGCENLVISAGVGASCLITNTVFFEGIPTLSQIGMAILALLMLSVGLVGFRRLA